MRPFQVACIPYRAARQNLADRLEHHAVAGIATDIGLAINAATIVAHRRVTDPPPPCRNHATGNGVLEDEWRGFIGHRGDPSILSYVLRQRIYRLERLCAFEILFEIAQASYRFLRVLERELS